METRTPQLSIPLQVLSNSDDSAEIKMAAVLQDAGEVNRVIFKLDTVNSTTRLASERGGELIFLSYQMIETPTFVDYLRSGWQISLVAAVDYTGSNGEYTQPSSLHFMGPSNQYEAAILNVGQVVEPYDADRSFPVYGFGGIPRHMGQSSTNHCFAMNGNPAQPDICGIQNIIATYRQTLPSISLSGPTLFAPLLREFERYVKQFVGQPVYQIMLLLTDGQICDMGETKAAIVDLSSLPCSIIIIGVGKADFSSMDELDGDGGRLRDDRERTCVRDIVQFVAFNQAMAQGNLAEQVLREVPTQFCNHMVNVGFVPKPVKHDFVAVQ